MLIRHAWRVARSIIGAFSWIFFAIPTVVHECGHWMAFRSMGIRTRMMVIGEGRLLASWRIGRRGTRGRMLVEIRARPGSGYVLPVRVRWDRRSPLERVLIYLAGPAVEMLFAVVCITIATRIPIRLAVLAVGMGLECIFGSVGSVVPGTSDGDMATEAMLDLTTDGDR